ncbi:DUF308 domain-containing protein [Isoptericola sp. S6320L]|uniref:HdeD family acid-resistance protein n=1 Tax=Isoptericola sp. S6320L TaxID=2926411 RepID=UPI001FF1CF4E|nr:DUF308 domain-containing protein [Isoptericola sp. S6320L]MCK0116965.1 DUF308 domain-containing protein [Isoptericola sp. S6320L]
MSDASAPMSSRTVGTARRLWGLVYLRGAVQLVAGVVLFLNPEEGLTWLRWLVGIVIAVQGVLLVVENRRATGGSDGEDLNARLVAGIVSIVAGVLIVVWPSMTSPLLFLLVGIWACFAGAMALAGGLRGRTARTMAWDWQLVNAALWLVLGVVLLAGPTDDTTTVALLLALYLVLSGAVVLVGGLATTTRQKDADATVAPGLGPEPGATP